MRPHIFQSAAGLLQYLMATSTLNKKLVEEGKPEVPYVVDICDAVGNPHEILGAYDVLNVFTANPMNQVTVRILADATLNELAILAAVPKLNAFVSANTILYPREIRSGNYGAYKDIEIAALEADETKDNIYAIITSTYGIPREKIVDAFMKREIIRSSTLESLGLRILGKTPVMLEEDL